MQHNGQHSCASATVYHPLVPTSGWVKVAKLTITFRDYLPHVQHAFQDDWDVIVRVCSDYEQTHTHYSLQDAKKWKAYYAKVADDPATKKPSRPHFSISWLRPFIPLETVDYRALCT